MTLHEQLRRRTEPLYVHGERIVDLVCQDRPDFKLSKRDLATLVLLMSENIGTGRQRSSITRILNTLDPERSAPPKISNFLAKKLHKS